MWEFSIDSAWESNGKTAYQRVKGRNFTQAMAECGECIWYMKPNSVGQKKAEIRWEEGLWLVLRDRSG